MMIWSKCCLATNNQCEKLFPPESSGKRRAIHLINTQTHSNNQKIEVGLLFFSFLLSHIRNKKITAGSNSLQSNGSIRGSCSLAINIPVHRHVGHITYIWKIIITTQFNIQLINLCVQVLLRKREREITNGTTKDQVNNCKYTSRQSVACIKSFVVKQLQMRFLHFVLDCAICFGFLAMRFLGCNMLYLSVEIKYPSHPKVYRFENANLFSTDNLYLIRVYTFPAPEQF